ncbi:ABC transporter ATP-binding protein [Haloechinothrix sp. LS1_15]|uniref:ABC transporter ATP-binding protein n=1 Tax=Haloechinothrix sp. LS1_15 TaxID=2652248 RepID=UPI0029467081|nr:ABC transporter ATP-binding protein [Haloechinothrix sp. LS1_15]MDV6011198.1 ABC transporter ATP-binding protein [Haloechinothrix sp. LS1_15]
MIPAPLPLANSRDVRRWLRGVARAHRRLFVTMLTWFILAATCGLAGPQILGLIVDTVAGETELPVDALALAFLGILIVQAVLSKMAHMRAATFGEHVLATAREEFVGRALAMPVGTIEAAGTGDLLSRATTDVDRIEYAARYAAPQILTSTVTVTLTAGAVIATSPLLAVGMLVAIPVIVLTTRWYLPRALPVVEQLLSGWGAVQASTTESVHGARTIETLGQAARRAELNRRAVAAARDEEYAHRGLLIRWLSCLELSYLLPVVVILPLGGWAYDAGHVSLGTITTVVLYLLAMGGPLNELLLWVEELQIGNTALRRILGVRQTPAPAGHPDGNPHGEDSDKGTATAPGCHDLLLHEVRFSYRPGHEVLHGITLAVPKGEHLAVVGPSGSGKSTLARLLAGLAEPDSGTVCIGGSGIDGWSREALRRELVLLTQEHHVFAASLRDNLALTDRECPDERLLAALEVVSAGEWVTTLPHGLDTVLGPGAHPVTPDLAQRIALARVVLADPPIVVLDEAMAALGNGDSRELERSLGAALARRTIISITHRLATAREADRILVLHDGEVAELGSHAELMAAGGSYARLVDAAG